MKRMATSRNRRTSRTLSGPAGAVARLRSKRLFCERGPDVPRVYLSLSACSTLASIRSADENVAAVPAQQVLRVPRQLDAALLGELNHTSRRTVAEL